LRRGISPTVCLTDHIAASGNGAALIKPRLIYKTDGGALFPMSFLMPAKSYRGRHRALKD